MERFETEDQQVEAIKRFWKENGIAIIVGAVLGLGGLYGWRYYNDTQISAKEQASKSYEAVVKQLNDANTVGAEKFVAESDSGYSTLTALQLAKASIDAKDLEGAAKHLAKVADSAKEDAIKSVANIRLARVQAELKQFDAALATLDKVSQEAFKAQIQEVKGDILVAQGNFDGARAAYTESLSINENNQLIKMKLDNLAVAANG